MIRDDVGVVAIGRNEGEHLIRCLTSINSSSSAIVYVDFGSTDGSILAAERIGAHVVSLDLSRPFTAARARNEGFAALKVLSPNIRYIQFIDGDCSFADSWITKSRDFLERRSDIAVVCGRRRELHPTASVYNLICDIEWDTPIGEFASCGGDALMRVDAFEEVGGFRSNLIAGEEPELCVRLRQSGRKIWRIDADMTYHDAAMTRMGQFWARSVRAGYAYVEISRLHKNSLFGIWQRETARAVFWGGLLPLIICAGSLANRAVLAGASIYVFQVCRIAIAHGANSTRSWTYALFITIAKFAEFQGIVKFYWRLFTKKNSVLIEYK